MKKISASQVFLIIPTLIVVLLIGYLYASSQNFWKVTNPADPRFKIEKFAFNDYRNNKEMMDVIRVYIPKGTARSDVEKVFVNIGGAKIINDSGRDIYLGSVVQEAVDDAEKISVSIIRYGHKGRNSTFFWQVYVFYDSQDRVVQIVAGNQVAFKEGGI